MLNRQYHAAGGIGHFLGPVVRRVAERNPASHQGLDVHQVVPDAVPDEDPALLQQVDGLLVNVPVPHQEGIGLLPSRAAGGSLPPALPAPVNWSPAPANLPTLPTAAATPADISGSLPVTTAQNNVVTQPQGGPPANPAPIQAGAAQAGSTTANIFSNTAGSTPPPVNSSTPPVPPAPAVCAGNAPAAIGQNNGSGMTAAKAVTDNPVQSGENP